MPNMGESPLTDLAGVRRLLLVPTPDHLEAAVPLLCRAIVQLREPATGGVRSQWAAQAPALLRLSRQISRLHQQAGTIRWGAARRSLADSAGYTRRGESTSSPTSPHVAVTG